MNERPLQSKVAVLIFADGQQRDLRRRGFSSRHADLLTLPRLSALGGKADLHWFNDRADRPTRGHIAVHRQRGRTFASRLENAIEDLSHAGYGRMIVVGRDCPQLSIDDVTRAIELLDSRRLVIGPDHRGGCWLIGFHAADRALMRGVRWQNNTDARELTSHFGEPATEHLEVKFDLDHAGDLVALARVYAPAAALVCLTAPPSAPVFSGHHPLHFVRVAAQLPPPARSLRSERFLNDMKMDDRAPQPGTRKTWFLCFDGQPLLPACWPRFRRLPTF